MMISLPILKMLTVICIIITQAIFIKCYYLEDIPSVFPSRLRRPGLGGENKAWWAKEITPDFHVCGRLSDRQIKYAGEAGFKSILSLFTYPAGDPPGSFGGDYLPVTVAEKVLVEQVAGLQFIALLDPMDEWSSVEAVQKFTAIAPTLKKPALLHCDRGYTIAYVTLLYLANQTRWNPEFEPKIRMKEFFEITASMGLDFFSRIPFEILSEVTGLKVPKLDDKRVPRPNFEPEDWLDYWFSYPVFKNWFVAGQITKSHLGPLKECGYKCVVNIRPSTTYKGKPSQGEVNLLNIKQDTGTYGTYPNEMRQTENRLKQTLINPSRPNSYISTSSDRNYESTNEAEFGDIIGYNENLERQAFNNSGVEYHHMPLDERAEDFQEFVDENLDKLKAISKKGAVLVHCKAGFGAGLVATLAAADQYNLSLDWALQRLKEMGFGISAESHPDIYSVFMAKLSKNQNRRDEL